MLPNLPELPINDVLEQITSELEKASNLTLIAPSGAGKTTIVPLALIDAEWRQGRKILVLEPRRLAARSAAMRMASLVGEPIGNRVGYRVRFDTKVGPETIIEVITEGVFNRLLAEDPELESVAAVLFDEFHERSLDGDLALALCLDLQEGFRQDLRLVAMSATLDGAAVANLLGSTTVVSEGRAFPVEVDYYERPPNTPIETAMAQAVTDVVKDNDSGSVLAFLPGQREIERTATLLETKLPEDVELHKLYGALPAAQQDAALRPSKAGCRKVVLATAIAETSLTIEGIKTVVDSGLARQPVFEPATGLTRLQTVRASQASVTQRAGRAGRLGPGRAIRLWRKQQTAALPKHGPPEILNADLSSLLLDLTEWGVNDPSDLKWLDQPPKAPLVEAEKLLVQMAALTPDGRITSHGRDMRMLGLAPRYAHMVLKSASLSKRAGRDAALLSLLIQERGVGGNSIDLAERLLRAGSANDRRAKRLVSAANNLTGRLQTAQSLPTDEEIDAGHMLAFALPDRVAQNQGSNANGVTRFRLANGRGAEIESTDPLANEQYIVVADMIGRAGAARIISAAAISKETLIEHFDDQIEAIVEANFNPENGQFVSQESLKFGALSLSKPKKKPVSDDVALRALLSAVREHGLDILPWRKDDEQLRWRLSLLHSQLGAPWPSMDDASLLDDLENWLAPFLFGKRSLGGLNKGALSDGLMLRANHPPKSDLDTLVQSHFAAPSGSHVPIDYHAENAVLRIRPQELFGYDQHPSILRGSFALEIELLSPAGRPIQITKDLPGFWRGSWRDVRADLRGRYPKHPWPEEPQSAQPTQRARRRGEP